MTRTKLLGPLLVALLVLGGGSASASMDRLDPERGPKTQGPISLENDDCTDSPVRSDDGIQLGTAEVCLYVYSFDSLSEFDVLRDYGAVWLQGRFTPAAGWCASEVGARIQLSSGTLEGISKSPSTTAPPKKVTTRLVMDPGGNALEEARITQQWVPTPGDTGTVAPTGTRPTLSATWQGSSAKSISLVGGLAFSYAILQGPPAKISYGFSDFSLTSC